jgi:hypothetical protein
VKTLWSATWALSLSLCAVSATPSPLDDLRDCADKMRPEHTLKKLAEQCPNLDATLDTLGLSRLLDPEERERLNSDALRDLVALSSLYSLTRAAPGPSAASLAAIAEQVNGKKVAAPQTWWDRLKSWIKDWFSPSGKADKNWFDEWVRRMSDSTALLNTILYTCMGVVIVGALVVVFIEMRAAGLLRRKYPRLMAEPQGTVGERSMSGPLADSRSGVPRLLGLLVARLIATRRLQFERTLTHRELVARSLFDTPEQRSAFAQLSQAAESLIYGGVNETAIPQPVIEQGNSLLAQLTELPAKGAA